MTSPSSHDADNLVRKSVPDVQKENLPPFDFILVTTKNVPDVSPTVADIIAPAVTPKTTTIVLSQNGLNIEKPLIARFPENPLVSSISYIGATELSHGHIFHDDKDSQRIGAFTSPGVPHDVADAAARRYMSVYDPAGKLDLHYEPDVRWFRWRKLIYNSSFNSVAAVLRLDARRIRQSEHIVDDLIKPIMREIIAAATAIGVEGLSEDLIPIVIKQDPIETAFKPSMCQDSEKGNLMEIETIVGEPLREGEAAGVAMPTLRTVYGLLKGLQLKVKEAKGLWKAEWPENCPYK